MQKKSGILNSLNRNITTIHMCSKMNKIGIRFLKECEKSRRKPPKKAFRPFLFLPTHTQDTPPRRTYWRFIPLLITIFIIVLTSLSFPELSFCMDDPTARQESGVLEAGPSGRPWHHPPCHSISFPNLNESDWASLQTTLKALRTKPGDEATSLLVPPQLSLTKTNNHIKLYKSISS